ncbi:EAL domain-containing protein [Sulfurimonas sp. SAG-AH-194-C21]|nr:bifunctional diguanylate cyclase/phosphodiesterase [Sulfurimonas sp. SAG-AH-194-C21]MDF1882587.1 EAL domain-containing protein [Sulfurimonas sp. SAG-AH-194-C21]
MNRLHNLLSKLLHIGISSTDNKTLQLKKISINMVPLLIGPVGLLWSLIYLGLGQYLSALIPMFYALVSVITMLNFHKTKNMVFLQKSQMSLILILPFLVMWSLGGFVQSSYIFIWAFVAPVIALIHDKGPKSFYWLYSFISLVILSIIMDSWLLNTMSFHLSDFTVKLFFILNISIALSGIYFLIRYFIQEKDKNADTQLQVKHDALLTKIEELDNNVSYLKSYKANIDNNLIVTKTDIHGSITFANDNFYNITGYSAEEIIGHNHNVVRNTNTPSELFEELWQKILSKKTWNGTLQNTRKDGSSYWVDTTISPILNKDNMIVEFIAIRHDITKLIEHQDELTKLLYIDTCTGLKNRNALIKDIKTDTKLSAILVNIDNFSHINNLYGETFGDKVLLEFSTFIYDNFCRDKEMELYRLSGDEFILISSDNNLIEAYQYSQQLFEQCSNTSILIDDQDISLNITIGLSFEENRQLITTVNMAIIAARKEAVSIKVYTDKLSLNDEYENNLKWIKEIKDAIADDRITMFYQPIIDHADPQHKKYEALIRLIDKEGNVITPHFFLEIAKKAKLYKQLTKIVISKAFEAFKDNDYDFSINITIDDILDEDINKYIIETLQKYNISQRVIFEIVESESINDFDAVENFIMMVKEYGCRISIDDFGTGYSNFEHLMRLQADYIKIDGSIIKEITTNKRSELITSVIVAFAKEMNIETIGEYVETKEINDKLIELGVNKSQGYYFNKPQASLEKEE